MRSIVTKLIFTGFFVSLGIVGMAQELAVSESEISLELLKWHYHHYPNSLTTNWYMLDGSYYRAIFEYETNKVVTMYSADGVAMTETVDLGKNVPEGVIQYLDSQYAGDYKVKGFYKVTDFSENFIFYNMLVKSKARGEEVLNFDQSLAPVDFDLVSKVD